MTYTKKNGARQRHVTLRIPVSALAVMEKRATACGMTVTQYIKMLVIEEAADASVARIADDVFRLRNLAERYRDDFIFLASNLMANQKSMTIEEATQWVETHFGALAEDDALN